MPGRNEDKAHDCELSLLHRADDLPQIGRLAARTDLAMLPVGPPEAHGPHLPIGTDHTAALELCERAAHELEAEGAECLIAPLLPYCLAEVARPFPGTISVRAE